MSRTVKVAALQASFSKDMQTNIDKVKELVRDAAAKGAEIILPSELFCDHYFCKVQDEKFFATAYPWAEHPAVEQLSELAKELGVVIPVSIYEKDGP
ncbi:MAG TPA: N-carbamoylputrescine amidase, partial [Henriciella marina]|nr:N-carbamoylputrescine amidase [Henriciella marina]